MQGKIKLGVALGLASLAAAVIVSPAIAGASSTSQKLPYFIQWKPGTKLPSVPHGWRLMAEPTQAVMAKVKIGHRIPWVTPAKATPNTAGIVNLEAAPKICPPPIVRKRWRKKYTDVAQSYATVKGITLGFTYGNGQSSSLGVGISTTGADGSFTADGTNSVSTDGSQTYPAKHGPSFDHWQTRFAYEELEQDPCSSTKQGLTLWYVQAYQWDAGERILHPSGAPGTPHCEYYPGHSTFTKTTTKATTFSAGFSIGSPVSFNGSAQTGYTATAAVSFHFRKHGELCGAHTQPGGKDPGVIVGAGPK